KEDFFAYGLFFLGVRAVVLNHLFATAALSLIGAMTRETLLLLPLLFLVLSTRPLAQRLMPLLLAVPALVIVRLTVPAVHHDQLRGLWENIAFPVQTMFALFFMFGFGWVVIIPRLLAPATSLGESTSDQEKLFWKSLYVVFPLIVGAHLVLGR